MVSLQQSLLIFGTLAAFVTSAYAINCYQCESTLTEGCGEPFKSEGVHKADCSKVSVPKFLQNLLPIKSATGCMKTVNEVNGFKVILRSCYFGDIDSESDECTVADHSPPYVKQLSCDACMGNLCNGSISTVPIALAIAMLALVTRLL